MAPRIPKLRRQREPSRPDRAFVEIAGRRIHLGPYGSEEANERYARVVEEVVRGRSATVAAILFEVDEGPVTINQLILGFWRYAKDYYRRPDGTPTGSLENFRYAFRPLRELFGSTEAGDFGPKRLKVVRDRMIAGGGSRKYVNDNVGRIKRLFAWAVEEELVPASVHQALLRVRTLRKGQDGVKSGRVVRPVDSKHVDAVRPYVSRQVWAMIELQRWTGMRSGEVVTMRPCDVVADGTVWTYAPAQHKTAHRGLPRTIYLGPKAQAALRPFFRRVPEAYCFSPSEAEAERRERRHAERVVPISHGNSPGTNRKRTPKCSPGACYSSDTYRRAIERGCRAADVPRWVPHQLRHLRATELRREYGLEAARVILGHTSPAVTEHYAALDRVRAVEVVKQSG